MLHLPNSLRTFNRGGLAEIFARTDVRALLRDVADISADDRWNSFDGFARSARTIASRYRAVGAAVETYANPTAGPDGTGRWVVQEASDVKAATVDVVAPVTRRIADFAENPWSVVQWSAATPPTGFSGDVVVLDTWEQLRAVKAGALRGKIILSGLVTYHKIADFARTGAAGLLSSVPVGRGFGAPARRCKMGHATEWTKLGWGGMPMEACGFRLVAMALSEDAGTWLRGLVAKHGKVTVQVRVDVRKYVGSHELVCGVVKGAGDPQDEVWALAHSNEPGALDNASGVAACIGAAAAIEAAIRAGKLKRPKRSIRFLNGYECYGFFHYMEHVRRLQPALAGICVDTVGHKVAYNNGRLNWHSTAGASATFVNGIGEGVIEAALRLGKPGYRLVRQPFVSTEDTLVCDPKYGFPCPWINTHYKADRVAFDQYHTSDDTIGLVSPQGLRTCTAAVAGYLYYLADAGTAELVEMARAHTADVVADLQAERRRRGPLRQAQGGRDWAAFRALQHATSLRRLERWAWGGERGEILGALREQEREVREAVAAYGRAGRGKAVPAEAARVPFRKMLLGPDMENIRPEPRQKLQAAGLGRQPLFWADGQRNLAEIAALHGHELEKPVTVAQTVAHFEALAQIGFVDLVAARDLVSRARLEKDLRALGLGPGMDVMVHSALSKVGPVAGGAAAVIDALLAVIGKTGTLLMPSFNHGLAKVYNPLTTPTINGAIPDAFWRRAGVVRSMQGTHAVAAFGPKAADYCAGHVEAGIWTAESPIGKLVHGGGYILCLGVTPEAATAYHIAEVSMPCRCLRMRGGTDLRVMPDGTVAEQAGLVWRGGDCPIHVNLMGPALARRGELVQGKVGKADAVLCRAIDLWRVRRAQLGKTCETCKVRPDAGWKPVA